MQIKELCDINNNMLDSKTTLDYYRYLDTGNITRNVIQEIKVYNNKKDLPSRAKRLVRDGDIIISTIRPNQEHYGIIKRLKQPLIVSTGFVTLSPKREKVNGTYLYYYLTKPKITNYLQMIAEGSVSAYPSIKPEVIANIEVDFPDMLTQYEITKKIEVFDEKMFQNLKLIDKLKEYSQLLFYKWFVDFNFPNEYGKQYRKSGGGLEQIEGCYVPIGWNIISLNNIVEKVKETITPKMNPKTVYKHYSIPVFDDTKSYGEELGETILSNKYKVNRNNILVSKLNPWFKRNIYPMNIEEAICSTEFVVWNPLKENILEYLYVVANTDRFINYCTNASSGTSNSHKRVNPNFMMKYKVPYDDKTVEKFNNIVNPIIKKTHLLLIENNKLKEARDLLINKLII